MGKLQSGFASVVVILILLLGLGTGVYLIQQKTNLFPKAGGGTTIQIVDASGNPITTTPTAFVYVKLTAPWDPVGSPPVSGPIKIFPDSSCPVATAPVCAKGSTLIYGDPQNGGCPVYKCVSEGDLCLPRPACLDAKPPCLRPEPAEGWCPSDKEKKNVKCKNDADCGIGQYCPKSGCPVPSCIPGTSTQECRKLEKQIERKCNVSYCQTKPTPKPPIILGTRVILAEDPNFAINVKTVSYTKAPLLIKYIFSGTPGKKTLYAKFEKQTSPSGPVASINASPFPAVVELPNEQSPTSTPFCKTGVNTYVVGKPCEGGNFLGATFECYDGFEGTLGDGKTCKSSALWEKDALSACAGRSSCPKPSVTPPVDQCRSDSDCGQGGRCLKACRLVVFNCASGKTDCPTSPPCAGKCVYNNTSSGGGGISGGGSGVACTQDAKLCPNGSSVGRVAPKCEFAPCPGTK